MQANGGGTTKAQRPRPPSEDEGFLFGLGIGNGEKGLGPFVEFLA